MEENNHIQPNTSSFEGLREYYQLSSAIVWNMHCEFEEHLEEKAQKVLEQYQDEKSITAEVAALELHYIQQQLTTQARYAFLPRFLSLFEGVMKNVCMLADEKKYTNVDQRNWFKTHQQFLETQGVEFYTVDGDLQTIKHLIRIRDCIVHADGNIQMCKKSVAVCQAIEATEGFERFPIDDKVALTDQALPTASISISHVMQLLFRHFKCPLVPWRWH
ncbi:MAG: hypothetical protein AAGD11_06430 [Planctomycetota bacterium]